MKSQLFLFGILTLVTVRSQAQTARRLSIQSKVDQYELVLNGGAGTINGKPADLSSMKDLLPMLTNPLGNDCTPRKTGADVTIRENGKSRFLYLKEGILTDGENCLNVGGEGLLYFPIHRDFLIGAKRDGLSVKSPLKITRQGQKLIEIKKSGEAWVNDGSPLMIDWDFVEHFQNSLTAFDVRFRVLPEIGKDKVKVVVQSGGTTYEFYKITTVVWALKKPGSPWLEASDDWSFWYDLDGAVLEDRFAASIRLIEDKNKPKAERSAALEKLEANWTRNLRDLYHKLALDKDEDREFRALALKRLRGKPSKETAFAMAKLLSESEDEDFKKTASQILKINYPKGPLYKPNDSAEERAKVVEFWSHWWTQNQHAP